MLLSIGGMVSQIFVEGGKITFTWEVFKTKFLKNCFPMMRGEQNK